MRMLIPVLLGILGFLILYLVDYFELKKKRLFKMLTWFVGVSLLFIAHIQVILSNKTYTFPEFLKLTESISSIIFFSLLIYSVFIEIPILRKRGFYVNNSGLVVNGTYALSRHPGILWYILMLVSLFFSTGSKLLLISIPIWGVMDIVYAILQDKLLFPKLFGEDYEFYKERTRMFIPDINSIKACISTYRKMLRANNEKVA